jgi:hypothetical protein
MKPLSLTFLVCLLSTAMLAQVDDIKRKSSENSSKGGGSAESSSSGGGSGFASAIAVDVAIHSMNFFVLWQQQTLKKKETNRNITSLDIFLQTAIQPSTYYIVHPRIRANWGIFSTDFRMNYLIEEDIDGTKHIRTDDWQILQLNLVTARNATFRIGGGILHENYSGGKTFGEGTLGLQLLSNREHVGGVVEYRWSEPRKEWNGSLHLRLMHTDHFKMYATGGVVFQQYYNTINVWGLQGGLMLRLN